MKTIKKKQKHKVLSTRWNKFRLKINLSFFQGRGAIRTVSKQVPNDSFFNFFNPPGKNLFYSKKIWLTEIPLDIPEDEDKLDEESQNILATDFEIGHFIRSRVIPRAVLFYTGDLVDEAESGKKSIN